MSDLIHEKLHRIAALTPVFRRATALAAGVSASALTRLTRAGALERMGRGLYHLTYGDGYSHSGIVEAALQVPKGVIVLLSALNFHGIGTHPAREVWMQIPANFPKPRFTHPPLRVVRSRMPEAFIAGVEEYVIAGHKVHMTNVDRTIVDCFKHRNLVTLEVCLEALRERLQHRRHSLQAMRKYAQLMGVSRVMQPYIEALA